MPYVLLHDTLFLESLQTTLLDEGDTPPHLATGSDSCIKDVNKTTKDNKYPWLDKDNKR